MKYWGQCSRTRYNFRIRRITRNREIAGEYAVGGWEHTDSRAKFAQSWNQIQTLTDKEKKRRKASEKTRKNERQSQ